MIAESPYIGERLPREGVPSEKGRDRPTPWKHSHVGGWVDKRWTELPLISLGGVAVFQAVFCKALVILQDALWSSTHRAVAACTFPWETYSVQSQIKGSEKSLSKEIYFSVFTPPFPKCTSPWNTGH